MKYYCTLFLFLFFNAYSADHTLAVFLPQPDSTSDDGDLLVAAGTTHQEAQSPTTPTRGLFFDNATDGNELFFLAQEHATQQSPTPEPTQQPHTAQPAQVPFAMVPLVTPIPQQPQPLRKDHKIPKGKAPGARKKRKNNKGQKYGVCPHCSVHCKSGKVLYTHLQTEHAGRDSGNLNMCTDHQYAGKESAWYHHIKTHHSSS